MNEFINEYKWEGINFQSENDDWKKFVKNNQKTALSVLYVKKVTRNNSNHEKQLQ